MFQNERNKDCFCVIFKITSYPCTTLELTIFHFKLKKLINQHVSVLSHQQIQQSDQAD